MARGAGLDSNDEMPSLCHAHRPGSGGEGGGRTKVGPKSRGTQATANCRSAGGLRLAVSSWRYSGPDPMMHAKHVRGFSGFWHPSGQGASLGGFGYGLDCPGQRKP
jgi:hypothetical protein